LRQAAAIYLAAFAIVRDLLLGPSDYIVDRPSIIDARDRSISQVARTHRQRAYVNAYIYARARARVEYLYASACAPPKRPPAAAARRVHGSRRGGRAGGSGSGIRITRRRPIDSAHACTHERIRGR
jgi:hypothetical protein